MSNWNKIGKPIVVLCLICVVITGALAATNSATAPVIKAAEEAAAQAAAPVAAAAVIIIRTERKLLHEKHLPFEYFLPPIAIFALAKKDGLKTVFFAFLSEGAASGMPYASAASTAAMACRTVVSNTGRSVCSCWINRGISVQPRIAPWAP